VSAPSTRAAAAALALGAALTARPAAAQPPPVSPEDFVSAVSGSHAYEIMAARVVLTESRDPAVRGFAEAMIRDHETLQASLRAAAGRSGLPPSPPTVGAEEARLLGALQSLRGPDLDRAYARQQAGAHRSALATEEGYARSGSDPDLRAAAQADLPTIRHHLADAERLAPPG